jgi:DNA-binding GntR family transcriptional regulator
MAEAVETTYDFRVDRPAATLRHNVTEAIRNAIAVGRYRFGDRMPERDLCEMTGVSRTLVREALRQLESEGLVVVIPHKGPEVATISREQAEGIYRVREVLEGLAAELFAQNAKEADHKALHTAFDAVRSAYANGDVLARLAAKNRFYDMLVRGSANEALGSALHMLNARAMLLRGRSLGMPSRSAASLNELAEIVAALDARDSEKAKALAVHHVRNAALAVMESYSDPAA